MGRRLAFNGYKAAESGQSERPHGWVCQANGVRFGSTFSGFGTGRTWEIHVEV